MADTVPVSRQQIARLLAEREELLAANELLRKENGQLQQNREQLNQERDQLRDEVRELKRLIFGSKKERFVPAPAQNQLSPVRVYSRRLSATSSLLICRFTAKASAMSNSA